MLIKTARGKLEDCEDRVSNSEKKMDGIEDCKEGETANRVMLSNDK